MRYERMLDREGYLKVWLDSPKDSKKFLGIRKNKKDDFYIVERNLTNAIVLGDLSLVSIPKCDTSVYTIPLGLFDYQRRDVQKMLRQCRVLNANRMGYGKTVEAIATLKAADVQNAIIVAPKPILEQWKFQLDSWWRNHPDVAINPAKPIKGINIFNYEQITPEAKQTLLRSRVWDAVVVDEAHRIKTPTTKRTVAVTNIPARIKLALTGTPILKDPQDLYSQLRFLNPEYCSRSYYDFRNYYCDVRLGFFGEEIKGLTKDSFRIEVLNKLLSIVAIRNPEMSLTKGKQESIIKLGMDPKQRKLYKDIVNLILDELPREATIPNGAAKVLRAIQVTSSPSIFLKGVWGAKFEWLRMLVEDYPEEKIVVFSRFAKSIEELQKYMDHHKIGMVQYTGKVPVPDRHYNKSRFIEDPSARIIAGTIACMGEGVDGLQEASHIVVFLDRPYVPELIKQCEDRLNRPGQKERVLCYFLECRGTYDRHVGRVNETRAEDIRRALLDDEIDSA